MTEWVRIYGEPDNRPLQDALWFWNAWLPGALTRLEVAITCDAMGCRIENAARSERSPLRY